MVPHLITFENLLHYKTSCSTLRSSSQRLLAVPSVRLKSYGDRAFEVAAPKLWNTLPLDLRLCSSIDIFKNLLKTYIFKMASKQ